MPENAPENAYDEVPYPTFPEVRTHPDRLAAVAKLFGMSPAPPDFCRVLEIGCGDGGNLIPMAYALPRAQFAGIDLAETAVSRGCRTVEALKLTNVKLSVMDIRDAPPALGPFDYVVAHGLYSWVPPDVRDALLRACALLLAPHGIAFVSYNAWPGRHIRRMLREMMLYRVRGIGDPVERIRGAREFLRQFVTARMAPSPWQPMLEHETALLLEAPEGSFWHDDLAPLNEPVWFHEFAAHAARHRLQYLGDADQHLMFDPRGVLAGIGDVVEREQHLDLLLCRPFRMTLLCRDDVPLDRAVTPEKMDRFFFAAPPGGLHGIQARGDHQSLVQVTAALADTYPLPAAFEELLPYAESREELREILFALVTTGFATFHVHDFPCEETVTERPVASAVARYQASTGDLVTNLCHTLVKLDPAGRDLIQRLDGSKTREEIGEPEELAWMAQMALLVA